MVYVQKNIELALQVIDDDQRADDLEEEINDFCINAHYKAAARCC
ncbi:hypothetical protein GCM10020331_039480 [Ectobacillus funiculus]